MKKTFIKLAIASLIISFSGAIALQAQPDKKEAAAEEKKPANGLPFRGKIGAVDTAAKTITVAGKEKSRTFHVTGQTKITKDGQPAKLEDAKVGEEVGGFGVKVGEDKVELKSLRIGPKPEGEKKEPKKKKE